jgi:HAE1 family hydrophobic/amphiphilic exporter-1
MLLTRMSVKRPIMMVMIVLAFVIFGLLSFTRLPIDLMPDVEFPFVTVQTVYQGAGPAEVESAVVKPLEEELSTLNDLKNITAFCRENVGFILLEFNLGVDPDLAAIDVKDKVDGILYQLPADLEKPVISKFDINAESIINLAVTGDGSLQDLRKMAEDEVKAQLLKIRGVASIDITGGLEREIHVNLEKKRLDSLDLSIFQVISVIARQTADIPAGYVNSRFREYTVRVKGEFENLDEIASLQIPAAGGPVKLSSIARVEDAYREVREKARFNNENSVGLAVFRRPDANTVGVAKEVFEAVDRLNTQLPSGYSIGTAFNRSEFIEDSVNDTYSSMGLGILLTALILMLFLHDLKLTLIAGISMPASIIITFIGMQLLGFTLNIVTLMALAISVGILVTNSIVVLENIMRHRNEGMEIRRAAETGTNEIMVAIVASTLTNIAVFLPIATISGITGQFFKSLGLTIAIATVVSLVLSFTLTPLMASRIIRSRETGREVRMNRFDRIFDQLRLKYLAVLDRAIRYKFLAFLAVLVLLFVSLVILFPRLGAELFPQADRGLFTIDLEMPPGTMLEVTDNALKEIEMRVSGFPEVKTIYSSIGGSEIDGGVTIGQVLVQLVELSERERTTGEVINALRPLLSDIPDASVIVKEQTMLGGGGGGSDIEAEIAGDHMDGILELSGRVRELAESITGLTDVRLSWREARPEVKLLPDRMRMDEYGVTVADMGGNMRYCMSGKEVAVYREEEDEYDIRVQYSEEDRDALDEVEDITVPTSKGFVPVKSLADVVYGTGAAGIDRKNKQRMITVMANVARGATGTKTGELKQLTDELELRPGYSIHYGGQQEILQESFSSLTIAAMLAIVLTYMVLAGILESLLQPFIIMVTLPLGAIGVIWALFVSGNSISMISFMSVIMLIGIVVNNAILIIDYAHTRRREGDSPVEAVTAACGVKFKAILMMNLAIILAMIPQAAGLGSGGEIRAPFAITAIGGVVVSTLLTLFIIPPLYVLTAKKHVDTN